VESESELEGILGGVGVDSELEGILGGVGVGVVDSELEGILGGVGVGVFTARYALSPYIKQTRFVFTELMSVSKSRADS
jgi:hypothetical protein